MQNIVERLFNSLDNLYEWMEICTECLPALTGYALFVRVVIDLLTIVLFICLISCSISAIKWFNRH